MTKVSVIMPTFNRSGRLLRAIESVLCQTYRDFEILVVDDGSTDNTREVVEARMKSPGHLVDSLRSHGAGCVTRLPVTIRYFYQENRGTAAARNLGIKNAKGDLIAFLDDDDIWLEDKLRLQVEFMKKHQDVDLVYTFMKTSTSGGMKPKKPALYTKDLLFGHRIPPSSALIRKECFEAAGYFDERMQNAQDVDMWIRISLHHTIAYIPECLAVYGVHNSNASRNRIKAYSGEVHILEKVLCDSGVPLSYSVKKERLAKTYYLLGKEYAHTRNYNAALRYTGKAIGLNPVLGRSFFNKEKGFLRNALKIITPYCAYPYYLAASLTRRRTGTQ